MAHFSLGEFSAKSIPPHDWFLKSNLPDIALAAVGTAHFRV